MHRQEAQMGHMPHTHSHSQPKMPASSSRILLDVPCKVCRDHSSGKHYGIYACDGCAGFFKRSIRRNRQYSCKAKAEGGCMVDKTHRNQCRSCRLAKCIQAGMNRDAVQHERGPRNSTLRRQMAMYYGGKETEILPTIVPPSNAALNLVLPKTTPEPRVTTIPAPTAHIAHPIYATISCPPLKISSPQASISPVPLAFPISIGETIAEQAARLLFMNVTWVRDLNVNSGLCMEDQLTILEASWRELFLLSTAQQAPHLDPSHLLLPGIQTIPLAVEIARFREVVTSFHSLNLDTQEYDCVRAIVLYKAGLDCDSVSSSRSSNGSISPNSCRLKDTALVVKLRDNAHTALGIKMEVMTHTGAMRFSKLILMLPSLRTISCHAIEDFFFRRTIGFTPIDKIICDVYAKT
ncbi:nuclear receptor subfamily 2 group E member 1 [Phymastichus coffea]|uniref:nuclear receptor subfamily 2 group E member 1 n=1 Tax=Phymastichus coffea TaxID=108790 RepID=UPI00273B4CC4|nr:nuclear receptor subfamily 2 group E member 1 [Phymastichus coffea]